MVEVRDHRVGESEVVRREDELVSPAVVFLQHTVGSDSGLCSLNDACANGAHTVAGTLRFVDELAAVGVYTHLLRVHLMLCKVLHFDVVEVAQTAVERDIGEVDATNLHALHQLAREVQAGSRSRNGALVLGEDALEVVEVVLCAALVGAAVEDVAWQRSLAESVARA